MGITRTAFRKLIEVKHTEYVVTAVLWLNFLFSFPSIFRDLQLQLICQELEQGEDYLIIQWVINTINIIYYYSNGNNDRSLVMTNRFCSLSGQKIFEDVKMTITFVKNNIVCFISSSVTRMYYQHYLIAINKHS